MAVGREGRKCRSVVGTGEVGMVTRRRRFGACRATPTHRIGFPVMTAQWTKHETIEGGMQSLIDARSAQRWRWT